MGNMSYCRFENTLQDMQDCIDAIDGEEEKLDFSGMSLHEKKAFLEMGDVARTLADLLENEYVEVSE
jgi:hypothetical protein